MLPAEQMMVWKRDRIYIHVKLVVPSAIYRPVDVAAVKLPHYGLVELGFPAPPLAPRGLGDGRVSAWGGRAGLASCHPRQTS